MEQTLAKRLTTWATNLKRRAIYRRCLAAPSQALILRYHSVGVPDEVARYVDPGLSIPLDRFRAHLRILRSRFRVLPLDALFARVEGRESGPPAVAITFDDGYRDNHEIAGPILEAEGVLATFYVTSRPLEPGRWFWISELRRIVQRLPAGDLSVKGLPIQRVPAPGDDRTLLRRDMTQRLSAMDESERERVLDGLTAAAGIPRGEGLEGTFLTPDLLQDLARRGMTIGSHTRSHPHLDRLQVDRIAEEIEGGKRDLEGILGAPVHHFAYPNPGGGQQILATVRDATRVAGFRTAVTSEPRPLGSRWDPFAVPRLGVYAGEQERTLFGVFGR